MQQGIRRLVQEHRLHDMSLVTANQDCTKLLCKLVAVLNGSFAVMQRSHDTAALSTYNCHIKTGFCQHLSHCW